MLWWSSRPDAGYRRGPRVRRAPRMGPNRPSHRGPGVPSVRTSAWCP